jgi:hypothetical protein
MDSAALSGGGPVCGARASDDHCGCGTPTRLPPIKSGVADLPLSGGGIRPSTPRPSRLTYGSGEVSNEAACTAMVPIRVGTMRRKGASTFVPAICAKEISMSRRSATYFVIMLLAR